MTMSNVDTDVPIVRIDLIQAPHKVPDQWGRKRSQYRIGVRYTLSDGRTFDSGERFDRLRDANARADRLPSTPTNMEAFFHDGEFAGVTTHIRIGGSP